MRAMFDEGTRCLEIETSKSSTRDILTFRLNLKMHPNTGPYVLVLFLNDSKLTKTCKAMLNVKNLILKMTLVTGNHAEIGPIKT